MSARSAGGSTTKIQQFSACVEWRDVACGEGGRLHVETLTLAPHCAAGVTRRLRFRQIGNEGRLCAPYFRLPLANATLSELPDVVLWGAHATA
jgi:hypothetical protein